MDQITTKQHLENRSTEEIFDMIIRQGDGRARDLIMVAEILISQVGKEKAKELVYQARYDMHYKMGREAAEKMGNPEDLESFKKAFSEYMAEIKWVPVPKFYDKSPTSTCAWAENECPGTGIARLADAEMREFFKDAYCVQDIAWPKGFNPKIEAYNVTSYYDREPRCEWVWEIK